MTFRPGDPRITAAIQKAADTWGRIYGVTIPVELVRAMIVRESAVPGSSPVVVDTLAKRREPDGRTSYGLLQVLDETARDLGLTGDPTALFIPEIGISYGVKYLARQVKRYGGDVRKAVAAYNAGTAFTRPDGSFVNQAYVDFVLAKAKEFGLAVAKAAPSVALALLLLAAIVFAARARRAA